MFHIVKDLASYITRVNPLRENKSKATKLSFDDLSNINKI